MLQCVGRPKSEYCTACFSGEYRIEVGKPVTKLSLERHQMKMFT
jgi:glutamine phosphoribosylpyrophosphate amidotransferase